MDMVFRRADDGTVAYVCIGGCRTMMSGAISSATAFAVLGKGSGVG
jgi:hypothetical protein